MKAILFFLLITTAFLEVKAQDLDIVRLNYTLYSFQSDEKHYTLHQPEINLRFPLLIRAPKHLLLGSINYKPLFISGADFEQQHLHGISLQLLYQQQLSEKVGLNLVLSPGIFSDFWDLSSEDIRLSAGARLRVKHSEQFSYALGLGYSRQFFGNLISPFFEINWDINQRLNLSGQLPFREKLTYKINARWQTGLSIMAENGAYRLRESEGSQYLQLKRWEATAFFEYQVYKHWVLQGAIGHTLRQNVSTYDQNERVNWSIVTFEVGGKDRVPSQEVTINAPFVELGLALRMNNE